MKNEPAHQNLIIYSTEDGKTKVEVRMSGESLWLSQAQMARLFQKDKRTISEHIRNIYEEEELVRDSTVQKFRTTQIEGTRSVERDLEYYNLDMIIAVGYRVKSLVSTQFRRWGTEILSEYARKGFAVNPRLLKASGNVGYCQLPLLGITIEKPQDSTSVMYAVFLTLTFILRALSKSFKWV